MGSGYARVLPCHTPTKEVAQQCLELLLSDLRQLMGLSHKLSPQVLISDQGSQFVSHYFRDFLSEEQVKHWPATAYTPQQNAVIERLYGVYTVRHGSRHCLSLRASGQLCIHTLCSALTGYVTDSRSLLVQICRRALSSAVGRPLLGI